MLKDNARPVPTGEKMKHFIDYTWKKGVPIGIGTPSDQTKTTYLVLTEPYHRYYAVEKYENGKFSNVAYDSLLFDFRLLQPASQVGWRKEQVTEDRYLIRNLEEKIILQEEYFYKEGRCISCKAFSPHGPLISTQKILYTDFGDPINGVLLNDATGRCITYKKYSLNASGEFAEVLEEKWDMTEEKKISVQ